MRNPYLILILLILFSVTDSVWAQQKRHIRGPRDNLILINNIPFDKISHFEGGNPEQETQGGRFNAFAQATVYPYISEEYMNTLATSGTETEKVQKEMESEFSTLWTVVMLNMITADVLTLYIPEAVDEYTEFADGREADVMLAAAIMHQIPIAMIYLSRKLPYKANRLANIVAAGMMTAYVVGGGTTNYPHYIVIAGAEVVAMSLIAWKAWKWQNPKGNHNDKKHDLGLNLNYDKKAYGLSYTYNF